MLALVLLTALAQSHGIVQKQLESPRFNAIVEVYRAGVREIGYRIFRLESRVRTSDQDAELKTWNNGAFVISSGDREEVFWDNPRIARYVFKRGAKVVGWMGRTPIVQTAHGNRVPGRGGLVPLPKALEGAEDVLDLGNATLLAVRPFVVGRMDYAGRKAYSIVKGGRSTSFHAIGHGKAEFQVWKNSYLAANDNETEGDKLPSPLYGDIWSIGPGGSPVNRMFHRAWVNWNLGAKTKDGGILVTAGGFDGKYRKFHDYSKLYRLTPLGKLELILTIRGEWSFYGFDQTQKWVIGTRWDGWEMGAYDLVATNVKTGKEVTILSGVGSCRLIEVP